RSSNWKPVPSNRTACVAARTDTRAQPVREHSRRGKETLPVFHAGSARRDRQAHRSRADLWDEFFRVHRLVAMADHIPQQASPPGKEVPRGAGLDAGPAVLERPRSVYDRTQGRTQFPRVRARHAGAEVMISFTTELLHNFNSATTREWLETNGIGGFACSTVIGLNARRYHALLTAAMRPPSGRVVLLSKVEETVVIGGERYELSTNQYAGVVHPQGYAVLEELKLDPFPASTFVVDGVTIEKSVFMVHEHNTTVIQ